LSLRIFRTGFLLFGLFLAFGILPLSADFVPSPCEFWAQVAFNKKFSDRFTLEVDKLSKYSSGFCYYQELDLNGYFSSKNSTVYALGYSDDIENTSNGFQTEIDWSLSVIFNWKPKKWVISDQNQLEYRFFSYTSPNYLRYLNQLTLAYPIKTKRRVVSPYLSDQLAYDIKFDQAGHCSLNQNRVYLGVKSEYPSKFVLDVYYLRQTNGQVLDGGQPLPVFNVGGVNLTFKF